MKITNFIHPNKQMAQLGKHNWSVARLIVLSKDLPVMNIPLDHLNIYHKYGDLIAVPWVRGAASTDDLAYAIYDAANGTRWRVWWDQGSQKPHGRKAYAFDWGETNKNRDYCDLSIIGPLSSLCESRA